MRTYNPDELFQERFGLKVAARLNESTDALSSDITERLRVARMQALQLHKQARSRTASQVIFSGGGSLSLSRGDGGWGFRIASVIPLLALLIGLVALNIQISDNRANEVAEVDAALLTDDLPPTAYTDPGFLQFLKANRNADR
ncbi:MAG: DUF3619 family protein [Burkholderiaceae bacterium]